jgi:hypothetical protein
VGDWRWLLRDGPAAALNKRSSASFGLETSVLMTLVVKFRWELEIGFCATSLLCSDLELWKTFSTRLVLSDACEAGVGISDSTEWYHEVRRKVLPCDSDCS